MHNRFFRPRLLDCLKTYSWQDFRGDLAAGLTVGIVALPLAMAFAIASGVRPEAGLVTAVIAGFLISGLGGSRVQIGGPTGAFVVLVAGIVATYGLHNLVLCTIMAGVFLIIMGAARLGNMIKYIPDPVTTGFTTGIAVLIFTTQIVDFFGLKLESVPTGTIEKLRAIALHAGSVHWATLALAGGSLAIIAFWPAKLARFVPGSIVALALGTAVAAAFPLGVATIGSKFGGIPDALPAMEIPDFHWATIKELVQPALTIALLAAIESLLSAVVADGMIGERHDSNQELMAQGVANIVTPLFGGIPATGAIARTATNIRHGAQTPVAGIIHALTLLGIMLAAAPLAKYIPLATLSAVLVMVAYNMGEWHELRTLHLLPKSDAAVLLTVFVLTVVVDLTVAVEAGMVLAAVLFVKRISDNTVVTPVDETSETEGQHHSIAGKELPKGVVVYRVFGAFVFGATEKLEEFMRSIDDHPKVLILRLRKIVAIDATGLNALERLREHLAASGKHLVLSGTQQQPLRALERSGFVERLGAENVCPNIDAALARARVLVEKPKAAAAHS